MKKETNKLITRTMAIIWILSLCTYSSVLIGTLAHELMHKRYSIETKAIEVNYDTSGQTKGFFLEHSHSWVYLNGYIIQIFLFVISLISIFIIGFI